LGTNSPAWRGTWNPVLRERTIPEAERTQVKPQKREGGKTVEKNQPREMPETRKTKRGSTGPTKYGLRYSKRKAQAKRTQKKDLVLNKVQQL